MTDPFAAASASGATTATDDPFGQKPSEMKSSDFPSMDDLDGFLLVIQPLKKERLPSEYSKDPDGCSDRVTADCTVINLENPAASVTHKEMYFRQGALIGQVKGLIETRGMLLGRLRKHRANNTPAGYNTPDEIDKMISDWVAAGGRGNKPQFAWKLADFTPDEKEKALAWYRSKTN